MSTGPKTPKTDKSLLDDLTREAVSFKKKMTKSAERDQRRAQSKAKPKDKS